MKSLKSQYLKANRQQTNLRVIQSTWCFSRPNNTPVTIVFRHFGFFGGFISDVLVVSALVSFVSFLVKVRYLDPSAFPRFENTTALD